MPENQSANVHADVHANGVTRKDVPATEVTPRAKRRTYSAQYKLRILEEADRCTQHGEVGALLRREGLYSSNPGHLAPPMRAGTVPGPAAEETRAQESRGRRSARDAALHEEINQLRREKQYLEQRLEKAETIIEVQKKLSGLLGLTPNYQSTDKT